MPSVAAAVVAYATWPQEPYGWERHMTAAGNLYPEEDHEKDADPGHR